MSTSELFFDEATFAIMTNDVHMRLVADIEASDLSDEEGLKMGRMMAAAPELLAALKALLANDRDIAVRRAAYAAIAKARGES